MWAHVNIKLLHLFPISVRRILFRFPTRISWNYGIVCHSFWFSCSRILSYTRPKHKVSSSSFERRILDHINKRVHARIAKNHDDRKVKEIAWEICWKSQVKHEIINLIPRPAEDETCGHESKRLQTVLPSNMPSAMEIRYASIVGPP